MKLLFYSADLSKELPVQFAELGIRAGFPNPVQEEMSDLISLNEELIQNPATTFYARAVGHSMQACGIDDGDLLVIDRDLEPADGDIVVAYLNGEFTLRKVRREDNDSILWLESSQPDAESVEVPIDDDAVIWGVLTFNIKTQLKR